MAALLSAERLSEVRLSFPSASMVRIRNVSDIRRAIAGRGRGVLLLDPELLTPDYPADLSDEIFASGWEIVFDCRFSGSSARALLDRLAWRPGDVLVRPFERPLVDRVFDATENRSGTVELIRRLRGRFQQLPADTAVASIGVCLGAIPAKSCAEFALAAGQSSRTLTRHIVAAGLGTPHRMILVSRVVRSFNDLLNHRVSLAYVAERWGFENTRTLARHLREVTGQTPGTIRRTSLAMADLIRSACTALTAAGRDPI